MKKISVLLVVIMILAMFQLPASGAEGTLNSLEIENQTTISSVDALNYSSAPDNIHVFIYNDNSRYVSENDGDNYLAGYLYVLDDITAEIVPISTSKVITYTTTKNEVFFVTEASEIVCYDLNRSSLTTVGNVEGTIKDFDYFNGVLSCIVDSDTITFLDVSDGSVERFTMDTEVVSLYQFADSKLIWRDTVDAPYYLDISTGESILLSCEQEANAIMAPYITPQPETTETALMAATSTDSLNDITFPLSDYPANVLDYTWPYPTAQSYFNNTDSTTATCNHPSALASSSRVYDCKYYGGHRQCLGFALYAHDTYYHLTTPSAIPQTNDYYETDYHFWKDSNGKAIDEEDSDLAEERCKDFFESLDIGAYIRYGKTSDSTDPEGAHSIVLADRDDNGIWAYECNQDNKCGVYYMYYRYDKIIDRYQFIANWIDHSLTDDLTYKSLSQHKVNCDNCDAYVVRAHTVSSVYKTIASSIQHQVYFSCCDGGYKQSHAFNTLGKCTKCGYVKMDTASLDVPVVAE